MSISLSSESFYKEWYYLKELCKYPRIPGVTKMVHMLGEIEIRVSVPSPKYCVYQFHLDSVIAKFFLEIFGFVSSQGFGGSN